MKIDIEKLRAALAELGLDESQIEEAIALASEEAPQGEPEGNPEEESTPAPIPEEQGEPPIPPAPEEEGEGEIPPEEIPADPASVPPAEEVVPPVPPEEQLPPEVVPPVPEEQGGLPPLPEMPPVVPLEEFNQVKADLEETKAALQGLQAQCEALKDALKQAGVIDGSADASVGMTNPMAPANNVNDTTMDDILAEINRKNY